MMIDSRVRRMTRIGAIAALAFALSGAATPVLAHADTQAELDAAQAELASIGTEYQTLQQELQQAAASLEETSSAIETTTNDLNEAQALLAENVSGDYKAGGVQLLQVLLGATDFNDFVSRVFYLSKVNEAQAEDIQQVKDLQAQLEQQQAQQQASVADTQAKLDETAANQARAQELVNSLSEEVRAELEAKAAEDARIAAAMQSAQDAETNPAADTTVSSDATETIVETPVQEQQQQPAAETPATETPAADPEPEPEPDPTPTPTPDPMPSTPSGGSSGSSSSGTTGSASYGSPIAYALAMEGQPYVYGGESLAEGGFDCSGLVYYAYQCIGVTVPRTASSQMNAIKAGGGKWTTNRSQLEYGDLVFYPGHVAFYAGNGMVYGAQAPGTPAGYGKLDWYGTFLGGGRF